jgi:thiamine pyrophosphate-dependent acetolactate synthase large subunit-like protein
MKRFDCLEILAPLIRDEIVVTSGSGQRVEWGHLSQHEGNLFIGSLGLALGVGLGLAIGLPQRKTIVLEADGSLLLSLFNLPTLANQNPANLVVVVFDNQAYSGSNISHPTATAGKTDLALTAKGAGIDNAITVRDTASFQQAVTAALREMSLRFIVAKVEETVDHRKMSRPNVDLLENKYRFVRYLERTERKAIFPNERGEGKRTRSEAG